MRIAYVTQWFPPEPGTLAASEIADALARRGHQVDVLTGFPNYPDGILQDGWTIRPYHRSERSDKVSVHRAPLYPNHDSSALKRVANYLSFAAGAVPVALGRLPRPDVWLTYSSPATSHIPTMVGQLRGSVPACMIVQDLWPDSVMQSGMAAPAASVMKRPLDAYCNLTYRRSAAIGVISPSMRAILANRGVPVAKIFDTPNWVSDDNLVLDGDRAELRQRLQLPQGRLFVYAGNMGPMQNLAPLVERFRLHQDAQLLLIGGGIERPKMEDLANGAPNIHVRGPVPSSEVGRVLAAADVLIVSLDDTPLLRSTMPSKMQTSLAAGRAVLVHGAGDIAEVVTAAQAGATANPNDPGQLDAAIRSLTDMTDSRLRQLDSNARAYYLKHYSPEAGSERIERMLLTAVNERRRRGA